MLTRKGIYIAPPPPLKVTRPIPLFTAFDLKKKIEMNKTPLGGRFIFLVFFVRETI